MKLLCYFGLALSILGGVIDHSNALPQQRGTLRRSSTTESSEAASLDSENVRNKVLYSNLRRSSTTSSTPDTIDPPRDFRKLRKSPGARRSTTTPLPSHPNNDLLRRGMIEKLCEKKYGKNTSASPAQSIPASTPKSTSMPSSTPGPLSSPSREDIKKVTKDNAKISSSDEASEDSPLTRGRRFRSRTSREAAKATTPATASQPSSKTPEKPLCTDFDHLSFGELTRRTRLGLRRTGGRSRRPNRNNRRKKDKEE